MGSELCAVGELIEYSAGGGWGKEVPFEESCQVAIIRGADFPNIAGGRYDELPVRWEKCKKVEKVMLQPGDIVLENSGGTDTRPTGRTIFITKEFLDAYSMPVIPASFCRLLRIKKSVNSDYLYYWLQDMFNQGRTWGYQNRSTGLSNFQFKVFEVSETVKLYTLADQARIANLLMAIDDKIKLNNRINDYLEELCKLLFECFETDDNNPFVVIGDIAEINPKRNITKGEKALCIEMADLSTTGSFPSDWHMKPYRGGMKFANGDTVMARITPCLENGKAGYINFLEKNQTAFGSTEYIVITTKGALPPEYFYFLVRNPAFVAYAVAHMNGSSGRQRVSGSDIEKYEIRMPSKSQLKMFKNVAAPAMEVVLKNSLESRQLAALRDSLLPKLMSGEIDVSQVDLTQLNNHLCDC